MEGDYQILSTIVPGKIKTNCYVIAIDEDAMILSAGSLIKTIPLSLDILNNADKFIENLNSKCLLYYEGMYCTNSKRPECDVVHETFNLKKVQSFKYGEANYSLYRLNSNI